MAKSTKATLAAVKKRFSNWQVTRTHASSPIPKPLWDLAVGLCDDYSVAEVSRELGIARSKLYGKLAKSTCSLGSRGALTAKDPFVTLALDGEAHGAGEGLDCEWMRLDGTRLRVRMPASAVAGVISSFLSEVLP